MWDDVFTSAVTLAHLGAFYIVLNLWKPWARWYLNRNRKPQ